tara:strand:- start:445 stop:792 length:348 start_codon:yes stop_codon:yes gene_type:complete
VNSYIFGGRSTFDEQTDAFERFVCLAKLSNDHKKVKGYDYRIDLKVELMKMEQNKTTTQLGKHKGKPAGKHIGKNVGKRTPVNPRTLKVGKVPTSVEELLKNKKPTEWIVNSFGS